MDDPRPLACTVHSRVADSGSGLRGHARVTSGIVAVVKEIAGRVRPCQALALGSCHSSFAAHRLLVSERARRGSFALASFVLTLNRPAGAILLLMADLVGLSRIALASTTRVTCLRARCLGR